MQIILNERTFKCHFGVGRFPMLPQFYKFAHVFRLNHFPHVWVIGNQRYQEPTIRYINQTDEVYSLVRGRKVLGDIKYLMKSVKQSAEVVGI